MKEFEYPTIELVKLTATDVITTSGGLEAGEIPSNNCDFGDN